MICEIRKLNVYLLHTLSGGLALVNQHDFFVSNDVLYRKYPYLRGQGLR